MCSAGLGQPFRGGVQGWWRALLSSKGLVGGTGSLPLAAGCFMVGSVPLVWAPKAVLAGSGSIPADVACGRCSSRKCVLRSGGDAQALCKHPAIAV